MTSSSVNTDDERVCPCGCGGRPSPGARFDHYHDGVLRGMVVRGERPLSDLDDFPRLRTQAMREMGLDRPSE